MVKNLSRVMKWSWGSFRVLVLGLALTTLVQAAGLEPGALMPRFEAPNQDGKLISSEDLKGKPVVIFFYPKDFTSGCTAQACQFRDQYSRFRKLGAVVLGVSRQGEKSHQDFKKQNKLQYDLLSDESGELAKALGVKTMLLFGWLERQSVLFGPDSRVIRFYDSVDPQENANEMLKDLEEALKKKQPPAQQGEVKPTSAVFHSYGGA